MNERDERRDPPEEERCAPGPAAETSSPGLPALPPEDGAPNEAVEADSWSGDRLAEAVGRAIAEDPESPLWRDFRSAAWLTKDDLDAAARDARRLERRADAEPSRVLELGEELRARAAARRMTLARREGPPVEIPPLVHGTPGRVLEYALEENTAPVVDLAVAAGAGRDLWDEPCDRWIELPNDVPSGRYLAVKVSGNSMAPLMHTGDTILVQLGLPLRRDRVIVARHPEDGYICKRVSRIRSATIELASLDPSRAVVTIPRDDRLIVGTVVLVWCTHRGGGPRAPDR